MQYLLMSRPARCLAQCSSAQAWSFSVRTNSACLQLPTAGTKTIRHWQPQQTLHTASTQTRAHWWVKYVNTLVNPHLKHKCRHTAVTLLTPPLTLCLFVWSRSLRVCPKQTQGCTAVSLPIVSGHPRAVWPSNWKLLIVSCFDKTASWCLHIILFAQKQSSVSPFLSDPLNMAILIAGAAGFLMLVLFCCICVCVCRRRGCCKSE